MLRPTETLFRVTCVREREGWVGRRHKRGEAGGAGVFKIERREIDI